MGKTFQIGALEVTLEKPSEAAFDAYVDLARSGRPGGPALLLANCVKAPTGEDLSRAIASKPAIKHHLVDICVRLADPGEVVELDEVPEHPGCLAYTIAGERFVLRPATEPLFDAFLSGRRVSVSASASVLNQACIVEPGLGVYHRLAAEFPALKGAIAGILYEHAGGGLEVIEKK